VISPPRLPLVFEGEESIKKTFEISSKVRLHFLVLIPLRKGSGDGKME